MAGRERSSKPTASAAVLAVAAALAIAASMPGHAAAASTLSVHGSVNQVYVTGAQPGTRLRLLDRDRELVSTKPVGSLGGVVFRRIEAGKGYRVRAADGSLSARVKVMK